MDNWNVIDEIASPRPSGVFRDNFNLQETCQSSNNPFTSVHLEQFTHSSELLNRNNNYLERSVNSNNPFITNSANQIGHVLQNFTSAFTETLKNFNSHMKQSNTKSLLYFYGYEHENPIHFLNYLNEHFLNNNVEDDFSKIHYTASLLKGEAKRWFEPYISLNLSWTCFCERFLYKFNDISITASYTAKLYGDKQTLNENVCEFISKKIALFNRLEPYRPEEHKSATIIELLRPDIRSRLRIFGTHISCEDLLHISTSIEADLMEEQKVREKNQQKTNQVTQMSRNNLQNRQSTEPPSACKYCNGWHFHRDCPRNAFHSRQEATGENQPENSRRVGNGPPQQNPIRNPTMGNIQSLRQ